MISNSLIKKMLPLLIIFLLISAPLWARPDWVDDPHSRYPSNQYLVGVGRDYSEPGAANRARSEIARIFQQRIQSEEVIQEQIEETFVDNGGGKFHQQISQQSRIVVGADEEIIGIQIPERHREATEGVHYALAVLNRSDAIKTYRQRLKSNLEKIKNYFEQSDNEGLTAIQKLRHISRAQAYVEQAQKFQQHLMVLQPGSPRIIKMDPSPVEVQNRLDALLDELSIRVETVELQGDLSGAGVQNEIAGWITGAFTELEFRISPTAEDADILVRSSNNMTHVDRGRDDATFYRWNININLYDRHRNVVFGSISHQSLTGGLSDEQAKSRSMRAMQSWLENSLPDMIVEKLLVD